MSKLAGKKYGKLWLSVTLLKTAQEEKNPFRVGNAAYTGFEEERLSSIKKAVQHIFRHSVGGQVYNVRGLPFSIITRAGTINIPANIVETINMGAFPYETTLHIGLQSYTYVGNKEIQV